jgi:hypothetical protein
VFIDFYTFNLVQAVRWEVNVIITDVTKTWLELRNHLQGAFLFHSCALISSYSHLLIHHSSRLREDHLKIQPHLPLDNDQLLLALLGRRRSTRKATTREGQGPL